MRDGLCTTSPTPDLWFPEAGQRDVAAAAKAICAVCPVQLTAWPTWPQGSGTACGAGHPSKNATGANTAANSGPPPRPLGRGKNKDNVFLSDWSAAGLRASISAERRRSEEKP
jgi:hypothetical protein